MTPPVAGATKSVDRQALPNSRRATARHARRISGPARSSARGSTDALRSAAAPAMALPAPGIALPRRRPSRPSAPVRRRAKSGSTHNPGIALRTVGVLGRVPTGSLLDRVMRGRLWIGLLAFALIGIVAMQLVVLKLNTDVGRALQRQVLLQRENAELGIENSVYSAENRIAPLAAATGMTFAPAGTVHFVSASPGDVSRAAGALSGASQNSTDSQSGSGEAAMGEADASSGARQEYHPTTTAEAEGSGSSDGESAAGSNESSSTAGTESSGAASGVTAPTAEPAATTTSTSSAGEQAAGVSGVPTGGASAPAGNTQASPQG